MTGGEFPGNLRNVRLGRRIFFAALCAASSASVQACGTIWGFQDPIDPPAEGGVIETPPSDIAGNVCVPIPPSGWQGPLILFEGQDASAPVPPPCLDGYKAAPAYDGNDAVTGGPAECSCTCGPASGGTCAVSATFFTDNQCQNACAEGTTAKAITAGPTCTVITGGCKNARASAVVTGGQCTPSAPTTKSIPAAGWSKTARACSPLATPQGGCAADRISTPAAAAPFDLETYCVLQTGAATCPATYPAHRQYYGRFDDTRACGACGCDAPAGAACAGAIIGFDNATCAGGPTPVPVDGGCSPVKLNLYFDGGPASQGSCTAKPTSSGSVNPANPTTICCTR